MKTVCLIVAFGAIFAVSCDDKHPRKDSEPVKQEKIPYPHPVDTLVAAPVKDSASKK
ncbi:hypothetical protein [Chryseobacterium sp. Leaf180]|uniref:hypothetical protein n=1 Tax=Chryseobacterium sp. Leaf180 TaxID=1736289 RepID=UPI000A92BBE2|nr:hypothetical protein [Chryseobacterium sp. Leaf180]